MHVRKHDDVGPAEAGAAMSVVKLGLVDCPVQGQRTDFFLYICEAIKEKKKGSGI